MEAFWLLLAESGQPPSKDWKNVGAPSKDWQNVGAPSKDSQNVGAPSKDSQNVGTPSKESQNLASLPTYMYSNYFFYQHPYMSSMTLFVLFQFFDN